MKRAPCFHTCITDIKKLCLAKAFFPYYQTPYWSEDLTDILDVPAVIGAIGQATPLYSITLTTRHLAQARQAGNAVVVRKNFEDKKRVAEGFQDFLRAQFLAGRQGIDKPWKPCFTACEDNTFTCWPMQTAAAANQRLFYFGFKETTANQRLCLKWTEQYVEYAPCFRPCPCNTPSMTAPFKPYRDMCQSDNGDFEPCTARRVSRKIHIREHDDRLALPPRADLSGVTTPLMLIVAAGIGCESYVKSFIKKAKHKITIEFALQYKFEGEHCDVVILTVPDAPQR
ncbi:unnamed protein product [Nippostrongylus brasiliensis]|uniref:Uncharacterized protein n=1 Tax=Nippostrongylus brasiliensis TaxID=27835 RepID=A0A0N4YS88_NIPBR|nr:unnamed protein product [Nippostrongylus brasiliensis]